MFSSNKLKIKISSLEKILHTMSVCWKNLKDELFLNLFLLSRKRNYFLRKFKLLSYIFL